MGGEGAMMAMITSLKNNSRRRKRHTSFDKNNIGVYGENDKPVYDFPKATPQVIKEISERLQKEHRQKQLKLIIVFGLVVVLIILFLIFSL